MGKQKVYEKMVPWFHGSGGYRGGGRYAHTPFHRSELNLLSFNIQAGASATGYRDYLVNGLRQFIPNQKLSNLNKINNIISDHDLVMLQEVDGGSLRSGFVNQLKYLAACGQFIYHYQQVNRDLGRWGQFSNGMLSRYVPHAVEDHHLPGLKGRGAILARYGRPANPLVLVGLHLALGERSRYRQLEYISHIVQRFEHVIVMGDLNCRRDLLHETPLKEAGLQLEFSSSAQQSPLHTYPSWAPKHAIDHILVSQSLEIDSVNVIETDLSDHCPLAMKIRLPKELVN